MMDLQEKLNRLFQETYGELKAAGIPVSDQIAAVKINTRARSRFGCCKAEKRPLGKISYTIEISRKVLDADPKQIKTVIAHELLHTCPGCMNHGKLWKQHAGKLNRLYGYDIKRVTSDESLGLEAAPAKPRSAACRYTLQCQGCGAEILRKKRCPLVEHPERYRCGRCGGKLVLASKAERTQ